MEEKDPNDLSKLKSILKQSKMSQEEQDKKSKSVSFYE